MDDGGGNLVTVDVTINLLASDEGPPVFSPATFTEYVEENTVSTLIHTYTATDVDLDTEHGILGYSIVAGE